MEAPEYRSLSAAEMRYLRACLRAQGLNLADLDETAARDAFWILTKTTKLPGLAAFCKARGVKAS